MNRQTRVISYLLIFGLVFLGGWEVRGTFYPIGNQLSPTTNSVSVLSGNDSKAQNLDFTDMNKVLNLLQSKYYDQSKISAEQMSYGIAKGLTESLKDPYTVYMDPTESKDFSDSLNSELDGIGAEMTVQDGALVIINTLNGSPAKAAGLMPNDIVNKIDGKSVDNLSLYDAINKIRGPKGTKVTLNIIRKGSADPFDITITRDTITVSSVESKDMGNGIWTVTINEFSDDTKMEFDKALNEIKLKKPKGLILDLRYNGGGYLEGAVQVLSSLLNGEKTVVTVKYQDASKNEVLKTDGKTILGDTPMVVLINEGSASAAEIVAGAIHDLKRGVLMGVTSYGKGSVQEVDPLSDGSSLRYTIAKWYTPNDQNIDHIGLQPDIKVEDKVEDLKNGKDSQMDEAVKYLTKN